jgi:hypothetical protein
MFYTAGEVENLFKLVQLAHGTELITSWCEGWFPETTRVRLTEFLEAWHIFLLDRTNYPAICPVAVQVHP